MRIPIVTAEMGKIRIYWEGTIAAEFGADLSGAEKAGEFLARQGQRVWVYREGVDEKKKVIEDAFDRTCNSPRPC